MQVEDLELQKKAYQMNNPVAAPQEEPYKIANLGPHGDEELINFLEQKLEQIEKQLKSTQMQYE